MTWRFHPFDPPDIEIMYISRNRIDPANNAKRVQPASSNTIKNSNHQWSTFNCWQSILRRPHSTLLQLPPLQTPGLRCIQDCDLPSSEHIFLPLLRNEEPWVLHIFTCSIIMIFWFCVFVVDQIWNSSHDACGFIFATVALVFGVL